MKAFDEDIKDDVVKNLDDLAKVRGIIESFQQEQKDLVDQAFLNCPDLRARQEEINKSLGVLEENSKEFTKVLTEAVLKCEESVKGEKLQAVFSQGKTTWDTSGLNGYALVHKELLKLRKTGKPSVSIREIKS